MDAMYSRRCFQSSAEPSTARTASSVGPASGSRRASSAAAARTASWAVWSAGVGYATRLLHDVASWLDLPGLYCLVLLPAALVHLVARVAGRSRSGSPWSLALTLMAVTVAGARGLSLLGYREVEHATRERLLAAGVAEAAAVVAVAVPLAVLARRSLRTLPAATD